MKPKNQKGMSSRNMLKALSGMAVIAALLFAAPAVFACEMHFSLEQEGDVIELSARDEAALEAGESYVLKVTFVEDHRRCVVPPEETVYLMEYERWDADNEQPLRMLEQGSWKEISSGTWEQEIQFEAAQAGTWSLEVIRDCPKGGFNTVLSFEVR